MKKKNQLKVKYSNRGLANFFGDYIEINRKLKNHKRIRDYIMHHELGHSKKFDLGHEFQIDWKIMPSLIKFVIKNPSTWIDFLPIQRRNKVFIFDLNLILLYLGSIIIFSGLIFLFLKLI